MLKMDVLQKANWLVKALDRKGNELSGFVISYRSMDESVATVDESGEVFAVAAGSTAVVAHLDGVMDLTLSVEITELLPASLAGALGEAEDK